VSDPFFPAVLVGPSDFKALRCRVFSSYINPALYAAVIRKYHTSA
jgi:hypothetical protein